LVLFTPPRFEATSKKGNLMKLPDLSFFRAKRNFETPERHLTSEQSQHLVIWKRVLFIPLRPLSDQLHIVMPR
jgi:hypothetical protein